MGPFPGLDLLHPLADGHVYVRVFDFAVEQLRLDSGGSPVARAVSLTNEIPVVHEVAP